MWGEGAGENSPCLSDGHLSKLISCLKVLAAYPPTEASNLLMSVYLALQLIGCAAFPITREAGGLLLHLFTLTPYLHQKGRYGAVIFCHIVPDIAVRFLLESMMLFVARTFLLPFLSAGDHPHFCIRVTKYLLPFSLEESRLS